MQKESGSRKGFLSAEKTYNQYAPYYDAMTARHVIDLPIYQKLAATQPPPYLEIGCGTGRVLSYLLSKKPSETPGHYLTGVDVSSEMLAVCSRRMSKPIEDGLLRIMKHDFSLGPLQDEQFHAACVTFFTFNYIPEELQQAFLANIGKSLHSGGIIALDCFYPYLKWHPEKADQWIDRDPVIIDNRSVGFKEKSKMVTPDIEEREWVFTEPDGTVSTIKTNRKYISPEKLKELLETAGFIDIQRMFEYQASVTEDFTEGSRGYNFVLIARKP